MTTNNNSSSPISEVPQALTPLSHLAIVQVSGEEQNTYLQGQLTNDLNALHPNQGMLACHCDFKGKVWSNPQVINTGNETLLIGHRDSMDNTLAELKKFGVFSKVEITDVTEEYQIYGAWGEKAESAIEHTFSDVPFEHLQSFSNDHGSVICQQEPFARYLLLLKSTRAEDFCQLTELPKSPSELWELLDIQAGLPRVQNGSIGEFVPQMLNMQALNAISFSKGCYTGQEVVARTKYLGKNKRAGFILQGTGCSSLTPGENLEVQMGENWRRAGTIINQVQYQGQSWIFAVLPDDSEADSSYRSKSFPETQFRIQPLPYSLEE